VVAKHPRDLLDWTRTYQFDVNVGRSITILDTEFDAMATLTVVDGRRAISRHDGIVYDGLTC
jgi:hypothetical protein